MHVKNREFHLIFNVSTQLSTSQTRGIARSSETLDVQTTLDNYASFVTTPSSSQKNKPKTEEQLRSVRNETKEVEKQKQPPQAFMGCNQLRSNKSDGVVGDCERDVTVGCR